MAEHNSTHSNAHSDPNVLHPHISPTSMYLKVGGALFGLTILTVIAHQFHHQLGAFASPIAFAIALVKATLVLLYFMHLKDDTNMNRIIFATSFGTLLILLFFTVFDIMTRVVEVSPL